MVVVWFWQWSSPTCLPAYLPTCLPACLPVSVSGLIRGNDLNQLEPSIGPTPPMAVCWLYIRMVVVWGASLGGLDSIRFSGRPILRLWFNSTD